jgi:hypothetical protein
LLLWPFFLWDSWFLALLVFSSTVLLQWILRLNCLSSRQLTNQPEAAFLPKEEIMKRISFELISRWIIASTLIFAFFGAIQILPPARAAFVERINLELITKAFLSGLVIGLGVALAQWFVLHKFSISFQSWLLATTIGSASGWALGVLANVIAMRFGSDHLGQGGPIAMWAFGVTCAGSIGISQYLVLRRKYSNAKWWLIFTFSGWILAWVLSILPIRILPFELWHLVDLVMGVLFGLIFGVMTAFGLRSFMKSKEDLTGQPVDATNAVGEVRVNK